MPKPFLLLASRAEDVAAQGEYESFLRHTGLSPERLVRVRMEAAPFTPLDLDAYAGVILGGSPYTVSVPEAHKSPVQRRVEAELATVLEEIIARDIPFLGACFGIGTLTRAAGGVVDGTYAEDTSAVTVELTEDGLRDPLLAGLPRTFAAYVGHKESCTALPPGAVRLAGSAACPVQMYRLGANQYVTQFHPEADRDAWVTRIRVYQHAGYFPADEVEDVIERISTVDVTPTHAILRKFVERYGEALPTGAGGRTDRRSASAPSADDPESESTRSAETVHIPSIALAG